MMEDPSPNNQHSDEIMDDNLGEVDINFEGYNLCDADHDGIKQLLTQQFTNSTELNLSKLADALISQNFIGTILKQGETTTDEWSDDDTDDVFALVSCYSLTRPQDELCESIRNYLKKRCTESKAPKPTKQKFNEVMEGSDGDNCSKCLGIIINERFVNIPPQGSLPMFHKMFEEISEAAKKKHRSRFDFSHFIILSKVVSFLSTSSEQLIYQNAEEELLAENSLATFDYKIRSDDVTKLRRVLLLERDAFERSINQIQQQINT